MLKVANQDLGYSTQLFLQAKQREVDREANFAAQKAKAKTLWDTRKDEPEGELAFAEIRGKLSLISVGDGYCCYCDHNHFMENEIEHIYPKSTFPGRAFLWENFLPACNNCNEGHKKGVMKVFNPAGSAHSVNVGRKQPPTDDIAFIDPRTEDPMDYLELDLVSFQYFASRNHPLDSRGYLKAEITLKILKLNQDIQPKSRSGAFTDFKNRIGEYARALKAETFDELEKVLDGHPKVNRAAETFQAEKDRILSGMGKSMLLRNHQTVLREMLRQSDRLPPELQANIQASGIRSWLPQ
jgi:uncharacterized protein (TIGR02646 family)